MVDRTRTSLRGVRRHLLVEHRRGYTGVVSVATVTGAVVTAALNALLLVSGEHRSTGVPHEAVRWNQMIDVMSSFNGLVLGMGAVTTIVLLTSVAAFALEPRVPEIARLSLVGMTRSELLRLTGRELATAVLAGATAGTILGVPMSLLLISVERATGLAPAGLATGLRWPAFLAALLVTVVAGMTGGLLPVLRVCATRPLDTQEQHRFTRRRGRRRAVGSAIVFGLVALFTFVPETVVPAEIAVILIVPLVTALVVLNGRLVLAGVSGALRRLPGARLRPRVVVALSNAAAGGSRALSATQSIVVVLGFLVPLAMVMATGRMVFEVEASRPLTATTVVTFDAPPDSDVMEEVRGVVGENRAVPYASVTDLVSADDPYSSDQVVVTVADAAALSSQVETVFEQGEADAVSGASVATLTDRYRVGDTVRLFRPDGHRLDVVVVAEVRSNQYLTGDLLVDYATNTDLLSADGSVFRILSTADRSEMGAACQAAGLDSVTIMTRQEWVQQGIHGALVAQRQALTMIFLVPCLLALAATSLGVRAYAKVTGRSRHRMHLLGFTRKDLCLEYLGEIGVQVLVVLLELVVIIGLSAWKMTRMTAAAGIGSGPVLDTAVTSVTVLGMLMALVVANLVQLRGAVRGGADDEAL